MSDPNDSRHSSLPKPEAFDFRKLRFLQKDKKIKRMRDWFLANYEDPVNQMPYDSETGYVYINGGPYDAFEVLHDAFDGYVAPSVIDELADELRAECHEWAPVPTEDDFEDWLVREIGQISEYYHVFVNAEMDIKRLLEADLPEDDASIVYRLLFANVITAMETYLSDAFSTTVLADSALVRKYVESSPELQKEKFPVAQVYALIEEIERRVRADLSKVMWHDLKRVTGMYRDTLGVEFSGDLAPIYRAIIMRHHIVHRNGRDNDGNPVIVLKGDVVDLLKAISAFVGDIDNKLPKPDEQEYDEDLPF